MLFSVPFKEDSKAGIYLLFEHASSPKKDIYRQLFSYLAAVYKDKTHLSVVIPLVLYHGKSKWPRVKSLIDLLDVPSGLKEVLRKYVPDFTYVLLDVTAKETDFSVFTTEIRAFLKTLKEIWNLSDPGKRQFMPSSLRIVQALRVQFCGALVLEFRLLWL